MLKVLMIGGSGQPNYGDELILDSWLSWMSENLQCRVFVENNSASHTSYMHGANYNFPIHTSQILKEVAWSTKQQNFWHHVKFGVDWILGGGMSKKDRSSFVLGAISDIDVIHIYGGGYFNSIWPNLGFLLGAAYGLSELIGCKVVATGLGMTPLHVPPSSEYEALARNIIKRFSAFELRDQASYDMMTEICPDGNIVLGCDDVFLLSKPKKCQVDGDDFRRLHISTFTGSQLAVVKDILVENRDFVYERYSSIMFWEGDPEGDRPAYRELKEIFPEMIFASCSEMIKNGPSLAIHNEGICARYHPHIVMARLGMTGVYTLDPNHDTTYYATKHGAVVDSGSPFQALSMDEYFPRQMEIAAGLSRNESVMSRNYREKNLLAQTIYGGA